MLKWFTDGVTADATYATSDDVKDCECILINMDKASDRYELFLNRFHASDLRMHRLSRYSAVDGTRVDIASMLTPLAYKEVLDAERNQYRMQHYELTRGAVGCYLSHVGVWNRMLQGSSDCVIVFEDDAWVTPTLGAQIADLMQHVPADWDLVLLGHVLTKYKRGVHVHQVLGFYCLHGYLISRQGAQKIMQSGHVYPIAKQLDSMLSDITKDGTLNVYASPRQLVKQDNFRFKTQIQVPVKSQIVSLRRINPVPPMN